MSWAKAFVELDKHKHDRDTFDCGEAELNHFLKHAAARHMEANISRTLILPASTPLQNGKLGICSFYTVTAAAISRETLPEKQAKKLPCYPVPVFLIAQLAVDSQYRGRGLGKITLIKALEYLWEVNASMRAFAIVVDCLNQSAESFYLKYDFEVLCQHKGRTRMFIPMKTVGQLF
ncbi:MAG TPA: GNAT family N-acetyltransferase [Candidatus Obscuribacterales bacterium]